MASHRRTPSVPQARLSQPLPPLPLPLDDILLQEPYRDDPERAEQGEDAAESAEASEEDRSEPLPLEPPEYQPMHDYLRQQQRRNSQAGDDPGLGNMRIVTNTSPTQPYRDDPDEPFVINIFEQPPPSYNDLCREHEIEMQNLEQTLEEEADPAERSEDICKWIVAMLLIALTVASVGTAFNWGRLQCKHPTKC